jgi:hypothetical protein
MIATVGVALRPLERRPCSRNAWATRSQVPSSRQARNAQPRRKIGRQLTPLAAGLHHVEKSVDHPAQRILARSSAAMTLASVTPQKRLQVCPL